MDDVYPVKGVTPDEIARIGREFEQVSIVWSKLAIGESMTLEWASRKKGRS